MQNLEYELYNPGATFEIRNGELLEMAWDYLCMNLGDMQKPIDVI